MDHLGSCSQFIFFRKARKPPGCACTQRCVSHLFCTVVILDPEGTGKEETALRFALGCCSSSPVWILEHMPCEKRLGQLSVFQLEERRLQRNPTAAPSAYGRVSEGTKLCSLQGCTEEKGQMSGTGIKLKGGGGRR